MDKPNKDQKRMRGGETPERRVKRLRRAMPAKDGVTIPGTPPNDALDGSSASIQKVGESIAHGHKSVALANNIWDEDSVIAETDYEDNLLEKYVPPLPRRELTSNTGASTKRADASLARADAAKRNGPAVAVERRPFALPERKLADKSKMLEKVGLPGHLVYKAAKDGFPVVAQTHQIRTMLINDSANLLDKDLQDAIVNAGLPPKYAKRPEGKVFVITDVKNARAAYTELPLEIRRKWSFREEQYLGSRPDWGLSDQEMSDLGFPHQGVGHYVAPKRPGDVAAIPDAANFDNAVTPPALEPPPIQSRSKHRPGAWQSSGSDLYLLEGAKDHLVSATELSWTRFDPSPPDQLCMKQVDIDLLRMTDCGREALKHVSLIVRESPTSYTLVPRHGMRERSFKAWTARHSTSGIFLRDEKDDFLSVDRYNSLHQNRDTADPAHDRFAALCAVPRYAYESRSETVAQIEHPSPVTRSPRPEICKGLPKEEPEGDEIAVKRGLDLKSRIPDRGD